MYLDGIEVGNHAVEAAAGADALLGGHSLVGDAVDAVELGPGAGDHHVVERGVEGCLRHRGELVGGMYAESVEFGGIAATDAPYILDGKELQCLDTLLVGVDKATMAVSGVLLGEMAGHLGEGLVGRQADRDGDADAPLDAAMEVLAP